MWLKPEVSMLYPSARAINVNETVNFSQTKQLKNYNKRSKKRFPALKIYLQYLMLDLPRIYQLVNGKMR